MLLGALVIVGWIVRRVVIRFRARLTMPQDVLEMQQMVKTSVL